MGDFLGSLMDLGKLGQRIKQKREKRKLSQSDIAKALGLSAQAVSKWERGENAPDIVVLSPLSRLLGISIEWILTGNQAEPGTLPAVVFCTGISGYAERAQRVAPAELAAWANSIHYSVTETVLRHDGVPIKCVGDGFLGFFAGTGKAGRSLAAARQIKQIFQWPELKILLHSGEIYLGSIGHPDYARTDIIGQTVNTAFLALPFMIRHGASGIGLTEPMVQELGGLQGFQPLGETDILGISGKVKIYEPLPDG
jgi:transcriptional regulator with XRE-family HTH domain